VDWANEPYARLYLNETVDDLLLSWDARALWHMLLKKFDRAGVLKVGADEVKGLAALSRGEPSAVGEALEELLTDGRVRLVNGYLVAPNYRDANDSIKSDKQRQRELRERRRAQALAGDLGLLVSEHDNNEVTKRDNESRNVTKPSRAVTHGHSQLSSAQLTSTIAHPAQAFDFTLAYQSYPLKKGKKRGLAKCKKTIRTQEDFEAFKAAIETMASAWRGHDTMYCPHFSTFVSEERWRDEALPLPNGAKVAGSQPNLIDLEAEVDA